MLSSEAYERVVASAAVRAVLENEESEGWVIAGGAGLAIASGYEFANGDVDLFNIGSRGMSDLTLARALKVALQSEGNAVAVRTSKMAFTIISNNLTLQVVRHSRPTFESLFESFDLPCCEFAYDPRSHITLGSDRGVLALRTRTVDRATIRMHRGELVPAREAKYADRGFRFEGEFVPSTGAHTGLEKYYNAESTSDFTSDARADPLPGGLPERKPEHGAPVAYSNIAADDPLHRLTFDAEWS